MATKMVIYDLNTPGQDYDPLIKEIKAIANGTWWHSLDSTWIIKSSLKPAEIRDRLTTKIDKNDELLVIDLTGAAGAWTGFDSKSSTWLRDNWD